MNLQETLKHYFGYDSLRPGQQELIDEILKGKDVLGIMPTGAGKSLCYQLPALMMGEKHSREKTLQLQEDEVNVPCVSPPGINCNFSIDFPDVGSGQSTQSGRRTCGIY